ncbi:MAG TPA: dihydropyrimidinase [Rubrobacteraceae bacterium]|nr:dihydropyrimidinase [Rubrobacteraceae bacterium]
MGRLLFTGGTVITAEGSYQADVLVEDEKIIAVGAALSSDGAETVDASAKLVMPGFIDAHTHMDMPFGGTVTADDWATGTAAAAAGGTTTIIDFALQEEGGTLAGAVETWTEKARDKALIDYGFHVAITDLRDDVKTELPSLAAKGIASVKIFMAYKGTPLYSEDDDLFEVLQLSKDAGVLVLVHAENGDVIAKLQEQALGRGEVAPRFHALTRPPQVEAEATGRAIRLAEVAGAPILIVHVSCAPALEEIHRAHQRGQTVYAETCPQYFAFSYSDLAREGFEGAKYVCSPPLRDESNRPALWNGLKVGDLQIFGSDHCSFNYEGQKEMGRDDFTLIPNGLPGAEERAMALWTLGVREGRLSENQFIAALSTNQARIYGMYPKKGALVPGADADIVLWDPKFSVTATAENRHGNVDYTPYEGMAFDGGPASVYVRGRLVYRDGEIIGEHGSGRFVERSFTAKRGLEAKV